MRLDWTLEEIFSALGAAWHSPYTARVIECAIALLIALQVWALWRDAQPAPTVTSERPSAASTRPHFGASELSQLLGAHLFGAPTQEVTAAPALAPTAFKLVGLYVPDATAAPSLAAGSSAANTEPESTGEGGAISPLAFAKEFFGERTVVSALPGAIAWLSVSGAPGQRVQVGDAIGGGTVREIHPKGVTLELGGRAVRVAFPENPFLAMFRGESKTALAVTDPNAIPAELLSPALRFQPELAGNGLTGFRVYPGSDEGAFFKTGLRAGDVIESIGGQSITVPRDVIPLLTALRDAKPLALRLRRGPTAVELTLFKSTGTPAGARASRQVVLPPGYRPSPTTRPAGAPAPKPRVAPVPPPDLAPPPPSVRRSSPP